MKCDHDSLSRYQCIVRKQIEVFEAGQEYVDATAQGRNKPVVLGQVGIRCRHCQMVPVQQRGRGAVYYPSKLTGVYQAAQNMATYHLMGEKSGCQHLPEMVRIELLSLNPQKKSKSSAGGGKKYWADGVRVLGVYEDENGLRFRSASP